MRGGGTGRLLLMILKFYEDSAGRLITLIDVEGRRWRGDERSFTTSSDVLSWPGHTCHTQPFFDHRWGEWVAKPRTGRRPNNRQKDCCKNHPSLTFLSTTKPQFFVRKDNDLIHFQRFVPKRQLLPEISDSRRTTNCATLWLSSRNCSTESTSTWSYLFVSPCMV